MTFLCAGFTLLAGEVPTLCLLINSPGVYAGVLTLLLFVPELAAAIARLASAINDAKELCLDQAALEDTFEAAASWCDTNEKILLGMCTTSEMSRRQFDGLGEGLSFIGVHPRRDNAIAIPGFKRQDSSVAPSNPCSFIADAIPSDVCNSTATTLISNCTASLPQLSSLGINSTAAQPLQNACNAVSGTMDVINQGLSGLCDLRTLLLSQSQCSCPNAVAGTTTNSTTCQIESCSDGMSISSDGFSCISS
jgi:hypothetical protein